MLTLEELPASLEEKLTKVVHQIGGKEIGVRRMVKGDLPDDQQDVFVLEGSVRSQVELTRVLVLAAGPAPLGEHGPDDPPPAHLQPLGENSGEIARVSVVHQSPSFAFRMSLTACGLALPPDAFITCPTNQPIIVGLALA